MMTRARTQAIRRFILTHVGEHPGDIASRTRQAYGISRQAVNRHLQALVDDGLLVAGGRTRARAYTLGEVVTIGKRLHVTPLLEEDRAWREYGAPQLAGRDPVVRELCRFAFSEVVNNVLDHADARHMRIAIGTNPANAVVTISDDGSGIFERLINTFELEDVRHAVLELAKGRLTTSPGSHIVASLFYVAKLVDRLLILSGRWQCAHDGATGMWSVSEAPFVVKGTSVQMTVSTFCERRPEDIIVDYGDNDRELVRTHVPVTLVDYDGEGAISRSQARRLLARLDQFEEVLLDFSGVRTVGRGFADEVFRAFRLRHPDVSVSTMNASAEVRRQIRRALAQSPAMVTEPARPSR